ncbi:thiamine ABC transporter substrate binding subunit [Orbaceae bacterium ESL0727]|nr:thiamine ABC transporter substrate binding subunit [Orbaceae bacterium ESL0727]
MLRSYLSCYQSLNRCFKRIFSILSTLLLSTILSPVFAEPLPTLTVYTYSSFMSEWGAGEAIKKGFEAQCHCQLNVVGTGDAGTILNRIRLEGDKTKADVILGLDNNLLGQALKTGMIAPHGIAKPDNLNIDWWSSDFLPYDYGYFAFIYNQDKIQNPPKSLHEFIDNQPNWKIVYEDPRTSTPGLGLLFWMQKVYGDQTSKMWQKLAKHTVTVTKGWSDAYSLFLKGEADFVLSYSTSPIVHILNNNDHRYVAAIFDEGHYRQVEVAALVKQSKQKALAQQFLHYLLTADAQREFANKNVMYPIINIALPDVYQQIKPVNKALEFDAQQIDDYQKTWIREWQMAVSQ